MSRAPGEIADAIKRGYRVTPQPTFFPYPDHRTGETVHAEVDHAALAIFCSEEFAKTQTGGDVSTFREIAGFVALIVLITVLCGGVTVNGRHYQVQCDKSVEIINEAVGGRQP